jgi:drug/metabolite transporter (DMT)-like permease
VLIGADALQSIGLHVWAQMAILGAACSYGFAAIWGRQFRHLPPMITAFGSLITATVMMLPVALILERPWTASPTVLTWTALIGLATLSTAVAYLLYFGLINRAGATNAALVTFLIPLSAILLGAVLLDERLHWTDFAGMLLIFAGLGFVTGRLRVERKAALDGARPIAKS